MTEERSAVINIGGMAYELILTTRATKEIGKRYGGLENLGDKLMKSENFEMALDEIVWLIALLANQSILIHNLKNRDAPKDLLTETVLDMRQQGFRYAQIADSLGLSLNTVKSYCRRNILSKNDASKDTGNEENKAICKHCGKPLERLPKAKLKIFCDDHCRHTWWAANRSQLQHKAVYRIVCACCGTAFDSYGNRGRKYCCHACYIKDRFGKEDRRDKRQHDDARAI